MTLAIFDLDNTLLAGDSDHSWGEFLVEQNLVDATTFKQKNDQFYSDYCKGELDINAYLRFALTPLSAYSAEELQKLHHAFMEEKIAPLLLPKACELIESHRSLGHTLMVITATNRFITEPIVRHYGIEHLLASEGEIVDGRYTGEPLGTPCYAEGKVQRLQQWLQHSRPPLSLTGAYFYSDSKNDIPLLEKVDNPVAVDPDPELRQLAEEKGWAVITLRD